MSVVIGLCLTEIDGLFRVKEKPQGRLPLSDEKSSGIPARTLMENGQLRQHQAHYAVN